MGRTSNTEERETPKLHRLPVVSLSVEYLVMGNLMRRNILTYKAPQNHEGRWQA